MSMKTELLEAFVAFNEKNKFKVGDVVELKSAVFRSKSSPEVGQPCVVMDVFEDPILDAENDPATPYFREPLDIKLGVIHRKMGHFVEFHMDSRRFKHYTGE